MNVERLVQMANDIGNFFRSDPDRAAAIGGIGNHIEKFWTPKMRTQIAEHARAGGAGLDELPREAVLRLTQSAR
jgi:formate dehydrogenase subunit delta